MKKWIFMLITFCFAGMISIFYFTQSKKWEEQLDVQQSEIRNLQEKVALVDMSEEEIQRNIIQKTTGLDAERVKKDDEIAEEFLSYVMSWDSYEEYSAIRNDCMKKYNLTENSNFMTIFLPEVVTVTSNDGTVYNRIDTFGLNVKYEEMTSYVTEINADTYSYFTMVDWSSSDDDGNEAYAISIFTYSIDSNGRIFDIDASGKGY